jgi:hypothetical protein
MTARRRGGEPQEKPSELPCSVMSGWHVGLLDVSVARDGSIEITFGPPPLGPFTTLRVARREARELGDPLRAAADRADEEQRRRVRPLRGQTP